MQARHTADCSRSWDIAGRAGGGLRARTEEGVGDIQQDASDITLDLRVEAHLALCLRLAGAALRGTTDVTT